MVNTSSKQQLIKFLNDFENVVSSNPFEKNIDVYSVNEKMFLLIKNNDPVVISLRCDKTLSKTLQEKYESVMPGQKLDQDKWISIIDSGQLTVDEIKDLIFLSYNLAKETM